VITEPLGLPGAALLRNPVHADNRGTFRRVVDLALMAEEGLDTALAQVSVATNTRAGTVRGLHFQAPPHDESKTLWCSSGAVFDVLVDLRPGPTYGRWLSVELSAAEPVALHVPSGVAHGYQTLVDDSTLVYLISQPYEARRARCLRWDDPTLGIPWPLPVSEISERDRAAPGWPPDLHLQGG
jgi:dTDP-4-dehydrorhamnose 3,5-epimerase